MRRRSRHPVSCGERPSCSCLQTRHAMHPPYSRHTRRHAETTLDLVRACCHGLWRQTQCTKYQSLRCAIAKAASLLRYSADRRHAAVPSLACRALHALHTRRPDSQKEPRTTHHIIVCANVWRRRPERRRWRSSFRADCSLIFGHNHTS